MQQPNSDITMWVIAITGVVLVFVVYFAGTAYLAGLSHH